MKNPQFEQRLARALEGFVDARPACRLDQLSGRKFFLHLGDPACDGHLEGFDGFYDLRYGPVDLLNQSLATDGDISRMLAACEAVLGGRALAISGPGGYPIRSYVFTMSGECTEVLKSTGQRCFGRRARDIPKSQWRRERTSPPGSRVA